MRQKQNVMPSTSEVGHAKNVANFEHLISFCTGYGSSYNPSKNSIKLTALNNQLTEAQKAIAEVTAKTVAYNNNVNVRMSLFEPLKKLSTRLVNSLIATDASAETIADAKSINKKIQGQRASTKKEAIANTDPNQPAPESISTSQQSYDQLTEHFSKIIELLGAEASYTPNETELQVSTLDTQLKDLRTANTNVGNAYTAISNSRIARNKVLYNETTGLCHTALEVKNYVKSVFGSTSPEYKQVSKLKFKTQ